MIWKKETDIFGHGDLCETYLSLDPGDIDQGALKQLANLRRLPFSVRLAVMPDIHQGYGMPIGGVLGTDVNVVIPNAVGVDIGCGMQAVKTNVQVGGLSQEQKIELSERIRSLVPVGFNVRREPIDMNAMPSGAWSRESQIRNHWDRACLSLGTLGGGNHFMEVQAGDDGHMWLMVHCGSRNLGKQICDYYNKMAKMHNKTWYSKVEPDTDLAFLHADNPLYGLYMHDMKFCVQFAKANRTKIMDAMLSALGSVLGDDPDSWTRLSDIPHDREQERIDICHNHASKENHLGQNMMVHRKGAAGPLYKGGKSIIPGSQGTSSFIVTPKDTTEMKLAMNTTSHGAGRPMSRSDAKRSLDLEEQKAWMANVVCGELTQKSLDEAPGAYKDIHKVITEQEFLCKVEVQLTPLVNIKG